MQIIYNFLDENIEGAIIKGSSFYICVLIHKDTQAFYSHKFDSLIWAEAWLRANAGAIINDKDNTGE